MEEERHVQLEFRDFDARRDLPAAQRIWREVGWLSPGIEKEEGLTALVTAGPALVGDIRGEAECLVTSAPGTMRYLSEELPFSCITSVTTSRIARRQGLAARLAARAVAEAAAAGAAVVGLSMFDQGFYNRLGFGTLGYEHRVSYDPAQLRVAKQPAMPVRLTPGDWAAAHAARLERMRGHGSCNLTPPGTTLADLLLADNVFGLGYRDGASHDISHCLWIGTRDPAHGPYDILWMSYQNWDQFLELTGIIASLADQVHLVVMREPPGIQFQDLLTQPFRQRTITEHSRFQTDIRASAIFQMRMCDVAACLHCTHLPCATIRFNLQITDPVGRLLDATAPWQGTDGVYTVTLGETSQAVPGTDPALPTLTASIGAFTRLWLGVVPASGLSVTDELTGPQSLLADLDGALRLPRPCPDWDF